MPHVLVCGTTGSGKTNYLLLRALMAALAGLCWIVFFAPHRKAGLDFIAQLFAGRYR